MLSAYRCLGIYLSWIRFLQPWLWCSGVLVSVAWIPSSPRESFVRRKCIFLHILLPKADANDEMPAALPIESNQMSLENGVSPKRSDVPIAIVGMGCRFPREATSPEKLWQLCADARSAWSEVPPERWNQDAFYHPDGGRIGAVSRSSFSLVLAYILISGRRMFAAVIFSRKILLDLIHLSSTFPQRKLRSVREQ